MSGQGEVSRATLLAAALDLLEDGGCEALTLKAVAQRAGLAHMAPYRHFADRDELVAALAEEGLRELLRAMGEASAGPQPAEERLRGLARAWIRFASHRPALNRLIFAADRPADPGLDALETGIRACCDAAVRACQADPRSASAERRAAAAWAMLHGLVGMLAEGRLMSRPAHPLDREMLVEEALGVLANGLRAP